MKQTKEQLHYTEVAMFIINFFLPEQIWYYSYKSISELRVVNNIYMNKSLVSTTTLKIILRHINMSLIVFFIPVQTYTTKI